MSRCPPNHPAYVAYAPGGFGALGLTSQQGGQAVGTVVGSVFGPIGGAIGGVIGGLVGGLFGHANHAQIAADVQAYKDLFTKYTAVAGSIPGRQIGLTSMSDIWKGAAFLNHFPGWNGKVQLIDIALSGASKDRNCFPDLWPRAKAAGVRDAKTFIDQYVLPANRAPSPCSGSPCYWLGSADQFGIQVLYDVADAYIAQYLPASNPYVTRPSQAAAIAQPTIAQPVVTVQPTPSSGAVQRPVVIASPSPGVPVVYQVPPGTQPPNPPQGNVPVVVGAPGQGTSASGQSVPESALIQQLLAQGATQQQAFQTAVSQMQAQGVAVNQQLAQQIAQAVSQMAQAQGQATGVTPPVGNTTSPPVAPVPPGGTPQAAGIGSVPNWVWIAAAGAALFAFSRPARSSQAIAASRS